MTIGNSAGTWAVSVLVLLCQASDGTPPSSRPSGGAVSREAVGPAPTPTKAPETGRAAEIAPPRTEPPTVSASAPPAEPSPSRKSAPPTGDPAPKQSAPEHESQPPPESATPKTLDLGSLEQRLRETKAIGVFTKLSLKNQVDDLLEQFREFHKARDQAMLAKLRQAYDLLLLKVLSLLQDGDPVLARDVSSSREALWNFLIDPDKFKSL